MFGNHKHGTNRWGETIDEAVEDLAKRQSSMAQYVENLQKRLSAAESVLDTIHRHYRAELCGDCCHVDVCSIFPRVKYGFECNEKASPCELHIRLYEAEPEESLPATENSQEGKS